MSRRLITEAKNTWCPGCGNFAIQHMLKDVLAEMEEEGRSLDEVVLVTGIGCHGKMADYLNINSFYAIHGRTIPVATGIKLANPDLSVICCAGDGDAYAEGLTHLIFAAKRNMDITLIVHDNRVYGLTTGQYTPTSPLNFHGRSTPGGTLEKPFNPLELALVSGATYIARTYTRKLDHLRATLREAIDHRGFSFVDVLQICATYYNMTKPYNARAYEMEDHDPGDFDAACTKMREWDYSSDAAIALGTFYRTTAPTFDEEFGNGKQSDEERKEAIAALLDTRG
ncbi:MAG: thiamine pyrophosphate-dependent enzyme [Methanomicrobiaceae archaeon]|nr:thiamine pyrophosphate-dependent enzyme [Methanomicrobiaceae archaeon]